MESKNIKVLEKMSKCFIGKEYTLLYPDGKHSCKFMVDWVVLTNIIDHDGVLKEFLKASVRLYDGSFPVRIGGGLHYGLTINTFLELNDKKERLLYSSDGGYGQIIVLLEQAILRKTKIFGFENIKIDKVKFVYHE
jgi:hypothetical protein